MGPTLTAGAWFCSWLDQTVIYIGETSNSKAKAMICTNLVENPTFDVTYQTPNLLAIWFQRIFFVFTKRSLKNGRAEPIWAKWIWYNKLAAMVLHTLYQTSGPCGFRGEVFSICMSENKFFGPILNMIWTLLGLVV